MKFLIINGPNINMLGIREPGIYGKENYEALLDLCKKSGEAYGIEIECFQCNYRQNPAGVRESRWNLYQAGGIHSHKHCHFRCTQSSTDSLRGSAYFQSRRKRILPADFLCRTGVFLHNYRAGNRRLPDGDRSAEREAGALSSLQRKRRTIRRYFRR